MNYTHSINDTLQTLITDEFMKALGLRQEHWSRWIVHQVVRRGTKHFSNLCAQLDADVTELGFSQAVRNFIPNFAAGCYYTKTETVPESGPLLITSNHPGASDVLAILSLVNRDDVHIVLSGVPITAALPHAQKHFIHVKQDANQRSGVIRSMISCLKAGEVVFIFPTGHVTPDPEIIPDAALVFEDWSESIALVLRSVPQAKLQMVVASGVIEKRYLESPLVRIRKVKWRQQILAEFLQITGQMMRPVKPVICPRITFMPAVTGSDLAQQTATDGQPSRIELHNTLLKHAEKGLRLHLETQKTTAYVNYL
jgi:hypothetical protein